MAAANDPLRAAREALRMLCSEPAPDGSLQPLPELAGEPEFLAWLSLLAAAAAPAAPGRADAVDHLNRLAARCGGRPLRPLLERGLGVARNAAGVRLNDPALDEAELNFRLPHLRALLDSPRQLLALTGADPRLSPTARRLLTQTGPAAAEDAELLNRLRQRDPFGGGRVFRYLGSAFTPMELSPVRPLDRFFGFPGMRQRFQEHFADFAAGRSNVPLLISSLPGHGKTQLTLANVLAQEKLTLILPPPEVLNSELPELFGQLAGRPDRKFVVFFDDLDPDRIDWYHFRTRVGGTFSPPANTLVVMASNYFFPPSILSRGRSLVFPIFDEIRCLEMVEDFLAVHGMRHPNRNLISTIAADYCDAFGQKQFSELSPRTLIRHLSGFERDRDRRRLALELASGPLVTKPDAQLFYDFNLKQMKTLYGKEYLDELLQEKLRALEGGA